jgi:hypothetical protein
VPIEEEEDDDEFFCLDSVLGTYFTQISENVIVYS